jgi:hypothetical protein
MSVASLGRGRRGRSGGCQRGGSGGGWGIGQGGREGIICRANFVEHAQRLARVGREWGKGDDAMFGGSIPSMGKLQ